MAILTECLDFIVPIKVIEQKYPGGWAQCLDDHKNLIGGRVWYDEHLFRNGAMNPMDIESLVNHWTDLGFTCVADKNGEKVWQDICVFQSMFGGATLPCDWIDYDSKKQVAFLRGTDPGLVSGPSE